MSNYLGKSLLTSLDDLRLNGGSLQFMWELLEEPISLFAHGKQCDLFTLLFRSLQPKTLVHYVNIVPDFFYKGRKAQAVMTTEKGTFHHSQPL